MAVDLKTKTVLFVDQGLFFEWALHCSKDFGRTMYFTPFINAFPKSNQVLVGDGFPNVERVLWFWDAVKEADLIVFLDVNFGDVQTHLEEQGKRVWGARRGEVLELNRVKAKKIMADHGVQPSPADRVRGIDNLRSYLKEHDNVFVKTSLFRGDFESFKSANYKLSEPKIDELAHHLGEKKLIYEFVCEPFIESVTEWGVDSFTISGDWPDRTLIARELKDVGALGKVMNWIDIPELLRSPNEKLSPWFKSQNYRGFFSSELLISENKETHFIDATCRLPSPPNEGLLEIVNNWSDILWYGAEGTLVQPEFTFEYVVIAMAHSAWADKNWQAVDVASEVRQFVKFRNPTMISDRIYIVPQETGLPELAGIVGVGHSLNEAISHLEYNAKRVEGYFIDIHLESIPKLTEELEVSRDLGIDI